MQRVIAGGTGLIGKHLVEFWLKQNHQITIIGRSQENIEKTFGNSVKGITWDKLTDADLKSAEVVVNLAGVNVGDKRWNETRKKEILESRVNTTKKLAELMASLGKQSPPLYNASAIGIYGLQTQLLDRLPPRLDESTAIDWNNPTDFLSRVGREWEKAAQPAIEQGARVVFLRFGVVLAKEGGALPQLMKQFKSYLGGPIGTGNQPFSWIAIDDVVRAIDFLVTKKDAVGAYNIVSPEAIPQAVLAQSIAGVTGRPDSVRMPAFVLKLMLGNEMAQELLLEGQRVYPKRLMDEGFKFLYPNIRGALQHVLK